MIAILILTGIALAVCIWAVAYNYGYADGREAERRRKDANGTTPMGS